MSFIETSALDASNVETAFQNILGGTSCSQRISPRVTRTDTSFPLLEIYHIVSAKQLDQTSDVIAPRGGETIEVQRTEGDGGNKAGGKCC